MKSNIKLIGIIISLGIALTPLMAYAYIGPGLGLGAVASVLGILAGLLMLLIGVFWYPIKRIIRFFRPKK